MPPSKTVESSTSESSGEEMEIDITPVKKTKKRVASIKTPTSTTGGRQSPAITPRSLGSSSYSLPSPLTPGPSSLGDTESTYHDQLPWLKEEHRKDKDGRRPDHPHFNPRTLYVSSLFARSIDLMGVGYWLTTGANRFP